MGQMDAWVTFADGVSKVARRFRAGAARPIGSSFPELIWVIASFAVVYVCTPVATAAAAAQVDFDRDVRGVFARNCFSCHGNDEAKRKAGLRLDLPDSVFTAGESGATPVVPGDPARSELYRRLTALDPDDRMPPPDSGKAVSREEIARIEEWIRDGAAWRPLWSLAPLAPVMPPAVDDQSWIRNPIDSFVLSRLEREGLKPSGEADRRTLIRRLSFDLLGLPPGPEEVEAFERDASPEAYERLVDTMLTSPRYGERWARHWLDVAHYGDTQGYDKDKRRPNAWPYRDYVIEAFNSDKPHGRFVEEQIAGDVLYPEDPKATIATGFVAAGPWDFVGQVELREGTTDKKITRVLDRDDIVASTMTAFVSMTVQCARCHSHKFDPIAQEEYYGLQAVFAGVDRAERSVDDDPAVFQRRTALLAEQRTVRKEMKEIEGRLDGLSTPELDTAKARVGSLEAQLDALKQSPSNGYHSVIESMPDVAKWVQVDLGKTVDIERIVLVPAKPTDFADTPGFGFPVRFKVETSDDAAFARATIVLDETREDIPTQADAPFPIECATVARYVRVTATRLWPRTGDYVFALAELQVMVDGKNAARDAAVSALDSIEAGRWSTKYLVDGFNSRGRIDGATNRADESAALQSQMAGAKQEHAALLASIAGSALIAQRDEVQGQLDSLAGALGELPKPRMVFAAAPDFKAEGSFTPADGPRPVHVLARGDVNQEGVEAIPRALSCVDDLESVFGGEAATSEGARRAALAHWISDPKNPLTWRSIVNRVWHYHFGRGIVDTPSDFGHMGSLPTHPELLDWLSTWFLDNGQSLKALHRLIVTSATYRQVSTGNEAGEGIDAGNALLWRMNRRQLDAESLRDAVLSVSGKLDTTMGGPGFDLFAFKDDHSPGYFYDQHDVDDPKSFRRSIYRFIVRSVPDPFMETLDCADPSQNVPARNTTITALQALAVMNNAFVVRQAEHLAERAGDLARAFWLALGREADAEERGILEAYAGRHGLAAACRVILNGNEFVFVD